LTQIAIIVEFQLNAGKQAEFEKIIKEHARRSKEEEKGCLSFDVLQPLNDDGTKMADCIWLTELYADKEAVAEHVNSPRMAVLGAAVESLVAKKRLIKAEMIRA